MTVLVALIAVVSASGRSAPSGRGRRRGETRRAATGSPSRGSLSRSTRSSSSATRSSDPARRHGARTSISSTRSSTRPSPTPPGRSSRRGRTPAARSTVPPPEVEAAFKARATVTQTCLRETLDALDAAFSAGGLEAAVTSSRRSRAGAIGGVAVAGWTPDDLVARDRQPTGARLLEGRLERFRACAGSRGRGACRSPRRFDGRRFSFQRPFTASSCGSAAMSCSSTRGRPPRQILARESTSARAPKLDLPPTRTCRSRAHADDAELCPRRRSHPRGGRHPDPRRDGCGRDGEEIGRGRRAARPSARRWRLVSSRCARRCPACSTPVDSIATRSSAGSSGSGKKYSLGVILEQL